MKRFFLLLILITFQCFAEEQVTILQDLANEINETEENLLSLEDQGKILAQAVPGVPIVLPKLKTPFKSADLKIF